jgi:hypothetical protein
VGVVLSASSVAEWVKGLGVEVPVEPGPLALGADTVTPDVRIVVDPVPGGPPAVDGLFDTAGFRLVTRGPPRRLFDETAYFAAQDADVRIRLLSAQPCRIAGVHVTSIVRLGPGPTLVGVGPEPAERLLYAASYLFTYAAL